VVVSYGNFAHDLFEKQRDHVTSHVGYMFIHHGPYEQHNKASKDFSCVD
jgi:hypothetical protein